MDRETMLRLWDASWSEGRGVPPWARAVGGLTAEQAAWRPGPGRHSIWQNVNHVSIWREYVAARVLGRPGLTRDEVYARNFEEPQEATAAAWQETQARLRRSHEAMREVIAAPGARLEDVVEHFGHDCYHLGQIMLLRALQGLEPIE